MFPETLRMTAPILVWNRDSLPKELEEFMYQNASPILIDGLEWVAVVDFDFFRQMDGYINFLEEGGPFGCFHVEDVPWGKYQVFSDITHKSLQKLRKIRISVRTVQEDGMSKRDAMVVAVDIKREDGLRAFFVCEEGMVVSAAPICSEILGVKYPPIEGGLIPIKLEGCTLHSVLQAFAERGFTESSIEILRNEWKRR